MQINRELNKQTFRTYYDNPVIGDGADPLWATPEGSPLDNRALLPSVAQAAEEKKIPPLVPHQTFWRTPVIVPRINGLVTKNVIMRQKKESLKLKATMPNRLVTLII